MLSITEGRVLGSLMEKQRTTPDQYPLSLNALRSACNQSSNREPVMQLDEHEIEAALSSLKEHKFVRFVHPSHGRSVTRYRQVADEVMGWSGAEYALMCLLLLRGPQTPGELRTRSDRLHEFDSSGEVDAALTSLANATEALVERLERQPGQKEARWAQLLAEAAPLALPTTAQRLVGGSAHRAGSGIAALEERVDELEARLARLEAVLADLV
jgi:uncharacterized protein YceH (UPF0502 family)